MRIIFVRHGNPNYELDCLTELGHTQAEAAAERLKNEGIEVIFSSSCGRALETARHTAEKIGLEVIPCDFIREIDWSSKDGTPIADNGSPWHYAEKYIAQNKSLNDLDWENDELYSKSKSPESVRKLSEGLDEWLEALGYKREGYYYRKIAEPKHNTVAMFSHHGAFSAAMTHIFNLPLPFALLTLPCAQSGVFEVELLGKVGDLVAPRFYGYHNAKHLIDNGIKVT